MDDVDAIGDIDAILAELAEIRKQLETLPRSATAERARLERRRGELHRQAAGIGDGRGDDRPTPVIEAELRSLRERLDAVHAAEIDVVTQHGGSALESSTAGDAMTLNRQIRAAQGADELRARIEHLERVLAARDGGT